MRKREAERLLDELLGLPRRTRGRPSTNGAAQRTIYEQIEAEMAQHGCGVTEAARRASGRGDGEYKARVWRGIARALAGGKSTKVKNIQLKSR